MLKKSKENADFQGMIKIVENLWLNQGVHGKFNWKPVGYQNMISSSWEIQIIILKNPPKKTLPICIVKICCATTDNTSRSIRLNSSKHDHAPHDAKPCREMEKSSFIKFFIHSKTP